MKDHQKGFFSYTRKERTGIIVLVCLIVATLVIPSFLPRPVMEVDAANFERLRAQLSSLKQNLGPAPATELVASGYDGDENDPPETSTGSLFSFDPNTLATTGWVRLGMRERTAATIQKYISRGGRFRRPEDLYKIYGLRKEEADRLIPYVVIPASGQEAVAGGHAQDHHRWGERGNGAWQGKNSGWEETGRRANAAINGERAKGGWSRETQLMAIDINTADTSAFIALRGIGSRLAGRIVHFREKLGGFHSVDQIGETYGLPDSTFQAIKPWLRCSNPSLRTININTADANLLDQHPYISRSHAYALVRYREQHGAFHTVDQLLQVAIMTPELLEKLRPYLAVE